jgi:hypothetical protein
MSRTGDGTRRGGTSAGQSRLIVALNLVVDFLAVHRDVRRRFDAELDEVALGPHHLHHNSPIDDDVFVDLAGKHEHGRNGLS